MQRDRLSRLRRKVAPRRERTARGTPPVSYELRTAQEADLNGLYFVLTFKRERACVACFSTEAGTYDGGRYAKVTAQLSDRERPVLQLLGKGDDMPEIASLLGLSAKMVEVYGSQVRSKTRHQDPRAIVIVNAFRFPP